jgi:hypothetical protein
MPAGEWLWRGGGVTVSESQVVHHFQHLLEGVGRIYTVHNTVASATSFLVLFLRNWQWGQFQLKFQPPIQLYTDSKIGKDMKTVQRRAKSMALDIQFFIVCKAFRKLIWTLCNTLSWINFTQAVMLLICIREKSSSNCGRNTCWPVFSISWPFSTPPSTCRGSALH